MQISLNDAVSRFYPRVRERMDGFRFTSSLGGNPGKLDVLADISTRAVIAGKNQGLEDPISLLPFVTEAFIGHPYANDVGLSCVPVSKLQTNRINDQIRLLNLAVDVIKTEGQDLEVVPKNKILRINDELSFLFAREVSADAFELVKDICERNDLTEFYIEIDGGEIDRKWADKKTHLLESGVWRREEKSENPIPRFSINVLKVQKFDDLPPSLQMTFYKLAIKKLNMDIDKVFNSTETTISLIETTPTIELDRIPNISIASVSRDFVKSFVDDLKQTGYKGLPVCA